MPFPVGIGYRAAVTDAGTGEFEGEFVHRDRLEVHEVQPPLVAIKELIVTLRPRLGILASKIRVASSLVHAHHRHIGI